MTTFGPRQGRRQRTSAGVVSRLVAAAFLLGAAPAAWATSPTGTLEALFERTNAVLQSADPARGFEAPRQAIRDLVNEAFDFRSAAAVALGPVWLSRIPADQEEFTRLFAIFLERGFIAMVGSKASVAGGVKIEYLGESIDGESALVATTLLTRGGQEIPVDYWMVRRGDRWKVKDVVVDGVSLVMNYRAQFGRLLAAYPYAELLARMRAQVISDLPRVASPPVPSAPTAPPTAETVPPSPVVVRDVPVVRAVKPTVAKAGPSARPATSRNGGKPLTVAAGAATPGDTPEPADVMGRLVVRNRNGAERDLAAVLARAGGTTLTRQRGPTITVVKGIVPHPGYGTFVAGLRGLGSWQVEIERSPLPNRLRVTVKIAE